MNHDLSLQNIYINIMYHINCGRIILYISSIGRYDKKINYS